MEIIRVCTKCLASKPSKLEFFHALKRGKDGLHPRCKICENQKARKWRLQNPEKRKAQTARNNFKNKDRIQARFYAKVKADHAFRACRNASKWVSQFLNDKESKPSKSIGCTNAKLKVHLESLFQPGMSWYNYGLKGWHIDHIVPLSKAYLNGPEAFAKACHYSNLRPLWAKDNIRKGNRQ